MGGRGRAWRRGKTFAFGAAQMGAFVVALRGGATVEEAALVAKVAVSTLYHRRRTCPGFADAWAEAAAASAGPMLVLAQGERGWQMQRRRRLPFGRERKQEFLDRFGATLNLEAAAAAAGVATSTIYRHLGRDAAFARGFDEALEAGYPLLEAEALSQQIAAHEAYQIAPDPDAEGQCFDRTMALLREYKRGFGRIGRRPVHNRLTKWSFDDAFEALEKQLKVFAARIARGERCREED